MSFRPGRGHPARNSSTFDRRRFLRLGAAALGGVSVAALMPGLAGAVSAGERRLSFHNLHTGENLQAVYWAEGGYVETECRAIDHLLRDFRNGQVKPIDRPLLDFLYKLQRAVNRDGAFHIISGYRSPETNDKLLAMGRGVSPNSLHLQAQAIDIRLPGCPTQDLRQAALDLQLGGVGYYPRSDFIHIDTGRVRFW